MCVYAYCNCIHTERHVQILCKCTNKSVQKQVEWKMKFDKSDEQTHKLIDYQLALDYLFTKIDVIDRGTMV